MLLIFGILIILACVFLGFFVLVQNPKGGGLSGSFGGFGNQVMGVRQTTDVLEKGTWILAALIAVLCMTSSMFVSKGTVKQDKSVMERNATTAPMQQTPPAPAQLPNTQPVK
ncbi:preprotein translocase subunit SecG [Chitinophaga sancti]|uniref:Protein-export membrane protein SecG n=1 Tax=Chitinophaga sancti TaxID=1004 RepID=A0A1K1RU96_9BACT|nr:preprotein translocase subunit SecG [Chitinophaga sancti]WQD62413.1 preprotein translocase subunit SecG [Chitinophaga sancti]WQG92018.1 preprotein translocase subunit SecG [Chitinophaga sancti]SFW75311.1 preprotein translocase subunit SecG [Chitinophaga sancti]